jgi:hypothetical protein
MGRRRFALALAVVFAVALLLWLARGCGPGTKDTAKASATDIVHVTATGKRYHREGCRSLSKSDIAITRAEAEARGLTPCKVCKP